MQFKKKIFTLCAEKKREMRIGSLLTTVTATSLVKSSSSLV